MISRRPLTLVAILAVALASAGVATVVAKRSEPRDDTEQLRRELARAIPTVTVRRRPVRLWEPLTAEVLERPGAPIGNSAARDAIVTAMLVEPGSAIYPGMTLATVQGVPMVLLPGALPSYRDLTVNSSGPDVDQLHAALRSLGVPCACGGVLTRKEIDAFRAWVFARSPVALDRTAWKGSIPQASIVWASDFSVVVDEVGWRSGHPARGPAVTTRSGAKTVVVKRVPAVSRVRLGQLVVARKGSVSWRSTVTGVETTKRGHRQLLLAGQPPDALGQRFRVRVLTVSKPGRALLVPTAAVGTSVEGVDRIVVVRDDVRLVKQVEIVADLGGRLAVRGRGLRNVEDVALPGSGG